MAKVTYRGDAVAAVNWDGKHFKRIERMIGMWNFLQWARDHMDVIDDIIAAIPAWQQARTVSEKWRVAMPLMTQLATVIDELVAMKAVAPMGMDLEAEKQRFAADFIKTQRHANGFESFSLDDSFKWLDDCLMILAALTWRQPS